MIKPTVAEIATWVLFGIAVVTYIIALFAFGVESSRYLGDAEGPAAVMAFTGPSVGLLLVASLLLTGGRQLLERTRQG